MRRLKSRKEDFTERDLPEKRVQVFAYCYKEHFSFLFRLGCLCLLLLLPTLIVTVMKDSYIINSIAVINNLTPEKEAEIRYAAETSFGIIQIGTLTLFFALLAGVIQPLKQMIWNEPVFFGYDFKTGLKSNAPVFIAVSFLLCGFYYFLNVITDSILLYISYALFFVFILPISLWVATQSVYYKASAIELVKNGVLFYIKTFPVTMLMIVVTIVPCWLVDNLIPFQLVFVKYLILIVLAIFAIVPLILGWLLYACSIFDKSINKEHYPKAYRKGLKKLFDEEEGEAEEGEAEEEREEG